MKELIAYNIKMAEICGSLITNIQVNQQKKRIILYKCQIFDFILKSSSRLSLISSKITSNINFKLRMN